VAFAQALDRAKDSDEIVVLPGAYEGLFGGIEHKRLTVRR